MANVHGLYSNKDDSDDEKDESNNRYVGGIGERGGGSGLAVEPNPSERLGGGGSNRDAVFSLAQDAGSVQDGEQIRRTITMYRDGFTVDDGPYRRLDDPSNADFLRALAMGRTPRELATDAEGGPNANVVVGLVDKRNEDYVETFQSFSGTGASLGSSMTTSAEGVFDPNTLPAAAADTTATTTTTMTSVAVRLPNGKRKVVQIALSATVMDLATQLRDDANGEPFRLSAGFPPQPLLDPTATIEAAGLKGAQVSMQKAA